MTEELKKLFEEVFINGFVQLAESFLQFFPKLVLGLLILFVGWIGAVFLRKIITKIIRAFGLDVISEKFGIISFLAKREIHYSPSALIGWLAYWTIVLGALTVAFEQMELSAATALLKQTLAYLPRLIVALIMLSLGIFLSGLAGNFVDRVARVAHIPFHFVLGQLARYSLIGLAIANALEYLHLAARNTTLVALGILGIIAGLILLIAGVCGRDLLTSLISQRFLKAGLQPGDQLSLGDKSGTILHIGPISTELETPDGIVHIPNNHITTSVRQVVRKESSEDRSNTGSN